MNHLLEAIHGAPTAASTFCACLSSRRRGGGGSLGPLLHPNTDGTAPQARVTAVHFSKQRPFSTPGEVQPLSFALHNFPPESATSTFYQPENRVTEKKYKEWISGRVQQELSDHWSFRETCWVVCFCFNASSFPSGRCVTLNNPSLWGKESRGRCLDKEPEGPVQWPSCSLHQDKSLLDKNCVCVCVCFLTLCDPMDSSLSGSSVRGILQVKKLE